jgi:hypothetical protein
MLDERVRPSQRFIERPMIRNAPIRHDPAFREHHFPMSAVLRNVATISEGCHVA